ncbi:MAG TPA: sugar ABC transporter substrate-binding protein [Candidatus Dojkabacteria bacterium]|nr:sugar ABC transporter substrate-binding protein [Candidatus Dojkabacteria bacterium]HQF36958.1 sugar ABC transporter substrate-binding protein [Candidatus Dojkabacteria bacterium]
MDKKKMLIIFGIIAVVIIILVIVAVVLSNKNSGRTPTDEPTDNGGTTTSTDKVITYWGLWEPESVMAPIIADYEAQNPGIKIQYVRKSFAQYEQSVYFQLAEPASPDIVRIHNTWVGKLQDNLSPLPSNIMSSSTYASTFFPIAQKSFTGSDGNLYAIPWEVDGLALYYNKALFAEAGLTEPPKDWDEFTDYAKKLTKTEGGTITQAGAAIGSTNNIRHADEILGLLLLQNNAIITNNDKVDLTDTRFLPTIKFYTDFVKESKVWSDGFDDDLQMFFQGKVGMMFAPSWRVFDIILSNPNVDFALAPVPQIVGNTTPVYYADYWGDAVSKNSKNQTEAWKFVVYLSTPEVMKKLYSNSMTMDSRAFGEPYSRPDVASEISTAPYVGVIMTMAPSFDQLPLLDKTLLKEMLYPIVEKMLSSGSVDSQYLSTISETINQKLALY